MRVFLHLNTGLILKGAILDDFAFIGTSNKDLKYIFTNYI